MSVYVAARDLASVPFGKHQFLIIVNQSNPYPPARLKGEAVYAQDLGDGSMGYVVGAQNRGTLKVEFFEASDYAATQEYFDSGRVRWYQADFDTEVAPVTFSKGSVADGVGRLFTLIENFALNQDVDPIRYPTAGLGYNSNSWAQTLIELAGGKVKSSDMKGWDVSNGKRIPKTYFEGICTVRARPVLNR